MAASITGAISCVCDASTACIKAQSVELISRILRVVNLINAGLLGLACYYAFQITNGSVTRFFLAVYIGIFAFLLFAFETRVAWTATLIQRQCGFMFNQWGRAVFLIFLGAVCFGMLDGTDQGTPYTVCLCIGLGTVLNAWFNCCIICSHPGFREAHRPAREGGELGGIYDPTTLSDENIRLYLEKNPDFASTVMSAAASGVAAAAPHVEDWARPREPVKPTSSGLFGRSSVTAVQAPAVVVKNPASAASTSNLRDAGDNPFNAPPPPAPVEAAPPAVPARRVTPSAPAPAAPQPAAPPPPPPSRPAPASEENPFGDNPFI